MNTADFKSHNFIQSEIATKSGDKEMKWDSPGFYTSLIQEALEELSFDTFFMEIDKVYDLKELGGCLELKMPPSTFNIRKIFGVHGNDCTYSSSRNIYWKKNYKNGISKDNWNNSDPFIPDRGSNPPSNLYYCGIANGIIYLSKNCAGFDKIVVRMNGLITDHGDDPIIPSYFRQAVVDYGVVEALSTRIANNPGTPEANTWATIMNRHDNRLNKPYDGSWEKARTRVKRMDTKSREDLREYMNKFNGQ
jgi:hypothetical protein